jgi:hypothetical protein
MPAKSLLHFRVSANLQKLIGEELVPNDEMAVLELVKNAYDSGAASLRIVIALGSSQSITVVDNGEGMDLGTFTSTFMVAGSSLRRVVQGSTRVPTGEKGIGRFAAVRLGKRLLVETRTASMKEVLKVRFDWEQFRSQAKRFEEIAIPYEHSETAEFLAGNGTALRIEHLRSRWDNTKIKKVRRALEGMVDPYKRPEDFIVTLEVTGREDLSGEVVHRRPSNPDYELLFQVTDDGHLVRKFRTPRAKAAKEWKMVVSEADTKLLSGVTGRIVYYISRRKKDTGGLDPGVQIYRDGFRIQPFGAPLADWLQLTEKRAKRAGHAPLVPSRLFGFIEVSRTRHRGLRDTTSRQAMLETAEMHSLVRLLKEQTTHLEQNLVEDVSKPRWQQNAIELERARLHSLGMLSYGLAHELRQPLQSIITAAGNVVERLRELNQTDADIAESMLISLL